MDWTLGIVGGSGMLGSAILRTVLDKGVLPPERIWIANRSGSAEIAADNPGLNLTTRSQEIAENCDVILLAIPPAALGDLSLDAPDRLIISVMAGVTLETLEARTNSPRVIRAMSSPAAGIGLAYSPWCAASAIDATDVERVEALFSSCGLTDRVETEEQIECFTAITGPVPGFVAFFAEAMVEFAVARGIAPEIADRAIRQLFLGAGSMMAKGSATPAQHVQEMIDYAGTTAAGLNAMKTSFIAKDIGTGLEAAVAKTRAMG